LGKKIDDTRTQKLASVGPPPADSDAVDIDAILAKYDRESATRRITGLLPKLVTLIALAFAVFQLYTAIMGERPPQIQRVVHLGFVLTLGFLMYPVTVKRRNRFDWFDAVLACLGATCAAYYVINYRDLMMRAGDYTTLDLVVGSVGILLVLEGTRRVVGIPILVVVSTCLAYAYFGKYLPGFLQHRGASFPRLVTHMFYTTEGILGIPLGVSSTFIFLFIMFGSFLEKTGIGRFFIDLGNAIAGKQRGGPAKVAVFSSGLQGTISGSSVANVVGTGSFTIPMMKSLGYRPEFAAAVEASASTGGQLMPPIMGAAAFLMAEFLEMPYVEIAKAAIIPAVLYFTGVWIGVDLEAAKTGLKGLPKERLPRLSRIMLERGQLILPIIGMIFFLATGRTPTKSALYGIILAILAGVFKRETKFSMSDLTDFRSPGFQMASGIAIAFLAGSFVIREFFSISIGRAMLMATVLPIAYFAILRLLVGAAQANGGSATRGALAFLFKWGHFILPAAGFAFTYFSGQPLMLCSVYGIALIFLCRVVTGEPRVTIREFLSALESGAKGALGVAMACAAAGIIVGTVTLTGLGLKLATGLVELAGGNLYLTLVFTMLTSLVLGMGAPTTANYVITSTIAAPAIFRLGVPKLCAHMFAFYFGIVADVTPPVALAAFAGSGIAKSDPLKTGINATKLSIAAFLIPYFFVLNPDLLLLNASWSHTPRIILGAVVGMIAVAAGVAGWLRTFSPWWERILLLTGGLMLIHPALRTDTIGAAFLAIALITQTMRLRSGKYRPAATPRAAKP
jgi:TRAP-type uncharacterized transport system fused permease subunit